MAYLKGDTATCDNIDKNAPLGIPTQVKRLLEGDNIEIKAKKARYEDTHDQKATLLDVIKKEVSDNLDNIESPSETEKILNNKTERSENKCITIKRNDSDDAIGIDLKGGIKIEPQ